MSNRKKLISKGAEECIRAALQELGNSEEDIERYIQTVEGTRRDYGETDKISV